MAENSKIQWTTHTFNPWRGCTKVAPGCANCYADQQSKRNPRTLGVWGLNGTRVVASEAMWREPVKWDNAARLAAERWPYGGGGDKGEYRKPRVFCASLADVFEDWGNVMRGPKGGFLHHAHKWQIRDGRQYIELPDISIGKSRVTMDDVRARLFRLIDETPNLDWLLLTKRPEHVRKMWCSNVNTDGRPPSQLRRENVWLGTSIACQEDADRYIPELLTCRDLAAKLFLSIEPLVGPVDLTQWLVSKRGYFAGVDSLECCGKTYAKKAGVDWVIVGGESGLNARPCDIAHVRAIVRQCRAAAVPPFVKQVGSMCIDNDPVSRCHWPPLTEFHQNNERCRVLQKHRKGGDPGEWPEDIRVREVPS